MALFSDPERQARFVAFKRKEYIGDALLSFILTLEFCQTDYSDQERHEYRDHMMVLASNKNLISVAKSVGIEPHPDDIDNTESKRYANAYEYKLADIYFIEGLDAAIEFVRDTLL